MCKIVWSPSLRSRQSRKLALSPACRTCWTSWCSRRDTWSRLNTNQKRSLIWGSRTKFSFCKTRRKMKLFTLTREYLSFLWNYLAAMNLTTSHSVTCSSSSRRSSTQRTPRFKRRSWHWNSLSVSRWNFLTSNQTPHKNSWVQQFRSTLLRLSGTLVKTWKSKNSTGISLSRWTSATWRPNCRPTSNNISFALQLSKCYLWLYRSSFIISKNISSNQY